MQCGAACLHTILRSHGRYDLSLTDVSSLCEMPRDGVSIYSINKAAQKLGFETLCGIMPPSTLAKIPLPAILFWRRCHFVVLLGIKSGKYIIGDPARGVVKVTPDELHEAWQTERSGDEWPAGSPSSFHGDVAPTMTFSRVTQSVSTPRSATSQQSRK